MKKTITLLSAMALSLCTFAQDLDFKWGGLLKSTGTGQPPSINDIDRDTLGNYYVVGNLYANDTVDFDIKIGVSNKSTEASTAAFIAKYSNTGDLSWVRTIEGSSQTEARSVLVRTSQDVLIGGTYAGTTEFDPAGGGKLSTATGYDYYILRLNPAGQYVTHLSTAQSANQYFGKLKQDKNGALYYSIRDVQSTATAEAVYKSSTNSSWQYYVAAQGSSILNPSDFAVDTAGNVYLVGGYKGSLYYNPANTGVVINSSSSSTQPYVVKISPSGQYIFNQNIGCDGPSSGVCVATDEASNVYFGGYVKNTNSTNFGNGFTFSSPTAENTFLVKYNPAGQAQWLKHLSGSGVNTAQFIDLDKRGNIYVSGYYNGNVDFNPDTLVTNNFANGSAYAPFVLKLTKEGNLSGVADLKAKGNGFFNSVKVINDEVLSVGRFSTDTVDLNLGAAESIFTADNTLQYSPFIAKHTFAACPATASATSTGVTVNIADAASYAWLDCNTNLPLASGATQSVVLTQSTNAYVQVEKGFCSAKSACVNFVPGTNVGINEAAETINLELYPNPTSSNVTVSANENISNITITDMLGKVVFEQQEVGKTVSISTVNFSKGIYLVRVESNGSTGTKKLIKE
jgi:hypothetical protein